MIRTMLRSGTFFLALFWSGLAFPSQVNLTPGGSVVLGNTTVTCGHGGGNPSAFYHLCDCRITASGSDGSNGCGSAGWAEYRGYLVKYLVSTNQEVGKTEIYKNDGCYPANIRDACERTIGERPECR